MSVGYWIAWAALIAWLAGLADVVAITVRRRLERRRDSWLYRPARSIFDPREDQP